ncbi:cell division protein FtsW [Saccharopolyspora lacisalsi]|uniref:Probable peptidoglycan glycosyltransferase FtsW n=1 Tax=Halosaccharopolyspora lacisalsi TaxID=1000566 RepID=A0A839DXF4_9PSEU|nr:putative lipid II flippase FtsW [Halosaccharopolyspora lacisalsi]MBA8823418.1 cell division protein FtsW [Halosaccharopolyspora lacisalsi]
MAVETGTRTGRAVPNLRGVRTALTAWLTRPLASFHLLLAVWGLLTVFGLVMVLSSSSVDSFNEAGSSYSVFLHQLLYVAVGMVCFYGALRMPVWVMRRFSHVLLLLCLLALALVLTPLGSEAGGSQSWFMIGGVSIQPVEFAKIAFALWGAHVLVTKRALLAQYRHLLVPVVPAALLMFTLVVLQPDLGSTVTLFILLLALLWFAGAPLRLFGMLSLGTITATLVLTLVAGYRSARLTSFLNPEANPLDQGYHARQALYALADGGLFGEGLGQGWAKWEYLPNAHNDFIFAVIGEELGFLGCVMVLVLYGTTAYVGMRIAARNTDPWIRLVSATLTTWLVSQAAINVCYVVGLLPVTGLPLPLISSGGSSVVTAMLVFGLLANCARHEPEAIAALRSLGPGRIGRLLRLPTPAPYRPPTTRRGPKSPNRPGTTRSTGPAGSGSARTASRNDRRGGDDARNRRGRPRTRGGHR